jgi:hypothetical protein
MSLDRLLETYCHEYSQLSDTSPFPFPLLSARARIHVLVIIQIPIAVFDRCVVRVGSTTRDRANFFSRERKGTSNIALLYRVCPEKGRGCEMSARSRPPGGQQRNRDRNCHRILAAARLRLRAVRWTIRYLTAVFGPRVHGGHGTAPIGQLLIRSVCASVRSAYEHNKMQTSFRLTR